MFWPATRPLLTAWSYRSTRRSTDKRIVVARDTARDKEVPYRLQLRVHDDPYSQRNFVWLEKTL